MVATIMNPGYEDDSTLRTFGIDGFEASIQLT